MSPQLISHFSTRVLSGQVRPVLGGGEAGDGGGAGTETNIVNVVLEM